MTNDLAVAEGLEPSHGRINSAVPYQLGYATEGIGFFINWRMEATKGVEPLSTGLQNRRSGIPLSYIAENLVDREGLKPSQEVCRTSMLSVTSPDPGYFLLVIGHFSLFLICNFRKRSSTAHARK